jgi:hypothetical protein
MKLQEGNKVQVLRSLLSMSLSSILLMTAIVAIAMCLILPLFSIGWWNSSSQGINQVFATHVNNTSDDIAIGEEIVQQGIVVSQEGPQINGVQMAFILPHRNDSAVYVGTLTFTTTKPVEVFHNHRISLDNDTLSQIDKDKFGELRVNYPKKVEHGGTPPDLPFVVDGEIPDYSTSGAFPYYSASIPFVADALVLGTTGNQPFIAFYDVAARVVEPEIVNHIEDAFVNSTTAEPIETLNPNRSIR